MKRPRISGSTRADLYCEDLDMVESEDPDQDLFSSEELLLHTSCGEKKRRLGIEQVKALEKSFEAENKLDPERKLRIARDLALQPRQVAVWFQNRRARWKTKQLERDYIALRTSYDNLAVDCDSLRRDKLTLLAEIKTLKTKLGLTEGNSDDMPAAEMEAVPYKDGSSDSDSSAVLFDENSSYQCGGVSLPAELRRLPEEMEEPKPAELRFDFQLWSDQWRPARSFFPKVEQSFNGGEEISSDLFSGDQHPIFSWYCGDHWS